MNDIPAGWISCLSGELLEFVTSGSRGWAQYYADKGAVFLRIGNLDHGTISLDLDEVQHVNPPLSSEGARTKLRAGDILISITAELGMIGIVPGDLREAYVNQHIALARPYKDLDSQYLAWFFAGSGKRQLLEMRRGATKAGLGLDDIRCVEVLVPPLTEQRRIVFKLERLLTQTKRARQALDAVPPLLDQLRQSILAAAFRGDLTADWRAKNSEVEPADRLLARIRAERHNRWEAAHIAKLAAKGKAISHDELKAKYREPEIREPEELQELSSGWSWASIELVGDVLLGRRRAAREYIAGEDGRVPRPYIRVANVKEDRLVLDDVLSMPFNQEELELYRLEAGDIVLSEGQSPELVGQSAIFEGDFENLCIQATVHRFRAYEFATTSAFAQLVFLSHLHTGVFRRAASLTTNIAHLTSERLRPLPFPVPPLAEQALIVERTRAALAHVAVLERVCAEAFLDIERLNASVLARAFRGELVPQDPSDEPASVLLERIRAARDSAESASTGMRRRSRKVGAIGEAPGKPDGGDGDSADEAPQPATRSEPARYTAKDLTELDPEILQAAVFAALWTHGALEKDEAVRRVAEHLRHAGHVDFQRLRGDGPLYGQILAALESAAKAGRLDRPKRGYVRACKADATVYRVDDWRHALLASLGTEPADQDDAIRAAAEWARDRLGLAFTRLRGDGHIAEGLRTAINSAIRRGEVIRHSATRIARAPSSGRDAAGQRSLTLDAPTAGTRRGDGERGHRGRF